MNIFSVSDNDLQLLNAIRPFMSDKNQGMLDFVVTAINIFNPQKPDQKINYEALNTLLTMVDESAEAKKNSQVIDIDDYEEMPYKSSDESETFSDTIEAEVEPQE